MTTVSQAAISGPVRNMKVPVSTPDGCAGRRWHRRKTLEQAVGQHPFGAAAGADFLGGLEDQVHGAAEAARASQLARRAQQYGGVAVVAAGVHAARVGAGVGQPGEFWIGRASMSARMPMLRPPSPLRRVPTTPVPPTPRVTS